MNKLIGYVRVSTDDQAREGVSLAAQEERIKAYVLAHGLGELEIVRDEGVSGTVAPDDRPGMADALRRLDAGEAHGLVAVRLDRWSRSSLDMLTIADRAHRKGWALHSVTEHLDTTSPVGRFTLTILAACAQLERDMIADRTRDALAHLKSKGAHIGGAPYGWRLVDGGGGKLTKLEPVPEEQEIMRQIRSQAQTGIWTQAELAERLNAAGIPSRSGRPWSRRGVQCVLAQPEQ